MSDQSDTEITVNRKSLVDVSKLLKEALDYWGQPYGRPTKSCVEDAQGLLRAIYNDEIEPVECFSSRCEEQFTSASEMWSHLHFDHNWAANRNENVKRRFINEVIEDDES